MTIPLHVFQELSLRNICSFDQEKLSFLSGYLLSAHKKNLTTRKIMPTSVI